MDTVNFYCLKWGNKYGDEYVLRLFNSIKKYCQAPFTFTCISDKRFEHSEIKYESLHGYLFKGSSIFTAEKIELMFRKISGNNVILDLDILIHDDITELVTCKIDKPTFIWTHWTPKWHTNNIPTKTACFVNSSFVRWEGLSAMPIFNHLVSNVSEMIKEYDSCDKYLYYEHHLPNNSLDFWPNRYFYNYNEKGEWQYKLNPNASVCLFNTSHLIKLNRRYYELDNTPTEHSEIWESYDEL